MSKLSTVTLGQADHPGIHNAERAHLNAYRIVLPGEDVQAAYNQAWADGLSAIVLADGTHTTPPLVLKRNPSVSNVSAVQIIGMGRKTLLRGDAASFTSGDALISWEAVTARAFNQGICNMTLDVPNVDGVRAVHYQPTAKSNFAEHNAERLQIHLENVRVLAHNDYHEELITLEGTINRSVIRNIEGDPAFGNGTYQTLLLKTDSDLFSGIGNDLVGLSVNCLVENLYSTTIRGGRGAVFAGRMNASIFRSATCDGGTTPCFYFINCIQSRIENLYTEGRSEQPAMYVFEGCQRVILDQFGIGTPNELSPGAGFGHGVLLVNTHRSLFRNRWIGTGNSVYSAATGSTKKLLVLDADSSGNRITDFDVRVGQGGLSAEIEDNGTDNVIEVVAI